MGMTNDGLAYWQAETTGEPLLPITIGDLLDQRARELATHEAVVYSCYPEAGGALDIRWSYQAYREQADEVARGLMALGLNKGDHIAVWAINLPAWLLLQMAAAKAGLVLVTINPAYRAAELEYVLKQGNVRALFFMAQVRDHNCLETVASLVTPGMRYGEVSSERLPVLRYVCLVGTPPPGKSGYEDWRPALFREMIVHGSSISADALRERQVSVQPQDTAMIQFTSGTTGSPKAVMLSHYSILNNAASFSARWGMHADVRSCVTMPFLHAGGCVLAVLGGLYAGSTLHPLIAFDPHKALQIISQERCNMFGAVPTMLIAMMGIPDFADYDLTSLTKVISGGAPVPIQLMEQVKERMDADVDIVFGQTEASAAITLTLPDDSFALKTETVGIPLPHVEVRIIDPISADTLPCGARGELCCRGYLVMQGYYNVADTQAIDAQGWLHTGDLATMDERGYVSIVGRLKEMVIRGGENIFPREIEIFLARHPDIVDVYVLGVPSKFFGEELLAVIQLRAGAELNEEALCAYCQGQISHQKIPRYFQFVEAFPLTASGKVQKFVLRDRAIKALGLAEETSLNPV